MKQRITIEQLNELSLKGKNKLRLWWKPVDGDLFYTGVVDGIYGDTGDFATDYTSEDLPLLSIGQMIEFLVDHNYKFDVCSYHLMIHCGSVTSIDSIFLKAMGDNKYQEIADVLWSAVKELLENENK